MYTSIGVRSCHLVSHGVTATMTIKEPEYSYLTK